MMLSLCESGSCYRVSDEPSDLYSRIAFFVVYRVDVFLIVVCFRLESNFTCIHRSMANSRPIHSFVLAVIHFICRDRQSSRSVVSIQRNVINITVFMWYTSIASASALNRRNREQFWQPN